MAEQAHRAVMDIALVLRDPAVGDAEEGPWDSWFGRPLLYAYLDAAQPGASWSSIAKDHLGRAVARIAAGPSGASLYAGWLGVAWAVAHLECNTDDANSDATEWIDAVLERALSAAPWRGHYDLVAGLAGLGVYALGRVRRTSARTCLSLVIDRLADEAETRDGGITWFTKPDLMDPVTHAAYPLGYYDCGLAHGPPAVAVVLAGACQADVNAVRARHLLDGTVQWMLSNRLEDTSRSTFARLVNLDGSRAPARSAWCYGDPGVAAALLAIAKAIGDDTLEQEALATARRACARPMTTAGVLDASLCHGAAGLALLYNRMWQATGDDVLRDAAVRWCKRTLELRRPGTGVGGYQTHRAGQWTNDARFLTGAPGIALSLLAATTNIDPAWDALLAVSIPATIPIQAKQ